MNYISLLSGECKDPLVYRPSIKCTSKSCVACLSWFLMEKFNLDHINIWTNERKSCCVRTIIQLGPYLNIVCHVQWHTKLLFLVLKPSFTNNFNWWRMLIRRKKNNNLNYKIRKCSVLNQSCQLQLFPLMRKKVPAATPSSPRVRPTPQNTAGPTLGRAMSTSETHKHKMTHMTQNVKAYISCFSFLELYFWQYLWHCVNDYTSLKLLN